MAPKPDRIRIAFQTDPATAKRIDAAHQRMTKGKPFANYSQTIRALLEAGLERDEENARRDGPLGLAR